MKIKRLRKEIEEVLTTLLDSGKRKDRIIFALAKRAIEFAERGKLDEMWCVWRYAQRLNAIGRARFASRLRDGALWDEDEEGGEDDEIK